MSSDFQGKQFRKQALNGRWVEYEIVLDIASALLPIKIEESLDGLIAITRPPDNRKGKLLRVGKRDFIDACKNGTFKLIDEKKKLNQKDEHFVKDNIPESVVTVFEEQNRRIVSGLKLRAVET